MQKILWTIIIFLTIALLALAKVVMTPKTEGPGQRSGQQASSKSQGKGGGGKVSVSVYIVKPQSMKDKIVTTGTVVADKDIELRSEASGRIMGIYFKEGGAVRKGALLFKINDTELQAQLAKAQAALTLAQEREKRQKGLFEKEVISREDYETAARDLASSAADAQLIKAQIDKTGLYAPFDGIVGLRAVDEGGYVTVGTKIANLVSLKPLKIEFAVPERVVGKVSLGSALTFTIEGSMNIYEATVNASEPKIDESTRTMKISAICTNTDKAVVPGAFAKVEMITRENTEALLVPSESLVPNVQGYGVYVVKDSVAAAQQVSVGMRDERNVEIVKGLREGDAVVASGVLSVRPGMVVDIRKQQ